MKPVAARGGSPSSEATGPARCLFAVGAPQLEILSAEMVAASAAYTVASGITIEGPTGSALERALRNVFTQPEVLRARLDIDEQLTLVAVEASDTLSIEWRPSARAKDLGSLEHVGAELLDHERHRVVDPQGAPGEPLHRLVVQRIQTGTRTPCHCVVFSTHHVFVDEYSTALLWRRVATVLTDSEKEIPDYPFSKFLARHTADLSSADLARAQIDERNGSAVEPMARVRRGAGSMRAATRELGEKRSLALLSVAQRHAVSPGTILSGALAHAVAAFRGGACLVNMPMSLRGSVEDLDVAGCAVVSMPILVRAVSIFGVRAVSDWQSSIQFAADRTHSVFGRQRRAGGANQRVAPVASIAVETAPRGDFEGVKWRALPQPTGPMKFPLMCFAQMPSTHVSASLRVLVDADVFPDIDAGRLAGRAMRYIQDLLDEESMGGLCG